MNSESSSGPVIKGSIVFCNSLYASNLFFPMLYITLHMEKKMSIVKTVVSSSRPRQGVAKVSIRANFQRP